MKKLEHSTNDLELRRFADTGERFIKAVSGFPVSLLADILLRIVSAYSARTGVPMSDVVCEMVTQSKEHFDPIATEPSPAYWTRADVEKVMNRFLKDYPEVNGQCQT